MELAAVLRPEDAPITFADTESRALAELPYYWCALPGVAHVAALDVADFPVRLSLPAPSRCVFTIGERTFVPLAAACLIAKRAGWFPKDARVPTICAMLCAISDDPVYWCKEYAKVAKACLTDPLDELDALMCGASAHLAPERTE